MKSLNNLLKHLGIDIENLKLTIKQYKSIIRKSLDKFPDAEIQFKHKDYETIRYI